MNDNNFGYFYLSVLANLCQLASFDMNVREVSNDEIMKDLERQDNMLTEQTEVYLKTIIKQNEEIIKLLKEKK